MANPWENDPIVQESGSQITATPLPRNPYDVRRDERDDARQSRTEARDIDNTAFDQAKAFRNEFRGLPSVAEYNVALGTFNSSMNTAPNAQGDQSLITSYAKMLDPTSAVREGEFQTTAGTQKFIDQIKAKFAKEFGEGGMLTEGGRQAIRDEMRNLVINRFQVPYERDRQQFQRFAQMEGIDPYLVVGEDALSNFDPALLDPPEVEENLSVATGSTAASELPQEYQNAHYAYLQQNWNDVDPADYERFRMALDERYEQTPDPEAYRAFANTANEFAAQGGRPAELGAVPSPTSEMGWMESQLNSAAQSQTGAFLANSGNATAFGLPARLTGNQERLEDIRDINPGASFMGEMTGSIAGTGFAGVGLRAGANAVGQGTRAASILSNPTIANAAYGTTYGATQDDNTLRGAATGFTASLAGDVLGRQIGKAFPTAFNRSGYRAADESAPSVEDLQAQANRQYADVEAQGVTADPTQTNDALTRANRILSEGGYLGPQGEFVGDGPVVQAGRLLRQYEGQPMTPTQAGAVRSAIGRGRGAMDGPKPDFSQRRVAGQMLDDFDDWADPVLPGVADARATSQRAILGREMESANEQASVKAAQFTNSGEENALRTIYRGMDMNNVRGRNSYPPELAKKIEEVARGTPVSNVGRWAGKFAPTGTVPTIAGLSAGGVGMGMLGPIGAVAAPIVMGTGLFGRKIATDATQRSAKEAELIARGADEYLDLLKAAQRQAAINGGRLGAGLSVAPASNTTR